MITIFHVTYTFIVLLIVVTLSTKATSDVVPRELFIGYTVNPNPSVTNFQHLLTDSTGNFSLSFLRVNKDELALAIVHVPSGESLWRANSIELARWGKHTQLSFNGSLVLADSKSGVFWSTNTSGDHVALTKAANLQVLKENEITSSGGTVLWESFDFPSDTLLENQNFTSNMSLVSSNGLYKMGLGFNFIGLYAKFNMNGSDQMYFMHRAMQAKTNIVPGHGPVMVRVSSDGFMGMYQNGSVPADIQTFTSYYRTVPGPRRVRLEPDGNLKGYYWSGSSWVIDYVAIPEPCELPSMCGPYGLCKPGEGCSCLDNQNQARPGECHPSPADFGLGLDLCGAKGTKYVELRRKGVELPYKELMMFTKTASYEQCEKSCVMNCTCWGVLYNNASGFCYNVDYPIETILGVSDESKLGYFKVWENVGNKKDRWFGVFIGLLCGGIILLVGVLCLASYKLCNRNRNVKNRFLEEEDIVSPGSYKDLGSTSFGSVELCNK